MEEEKKKCFVIMPISDADGYEKGHFTRVYEHLIKPAVIEAGFEPVRADDTSKANFIVVDILQQILKCDIAICDLSSRNPNVFYELGIRQAFNLRTILIKDNRTAMPFDISGIRTLTYNESLRIDEVKKTTPEMAKCIKDTYEADIKEVNSLLQLLSIEKPATLPAKVTLSQDSNMILTAINDLSKKVNILSREYNSDLENIIDGQFITLPDGKMITYGTNFEDDNNFLGKFISKDDDYIMVKRQDGNSYQILKYRLNDDLLNKLSTSGIGATFLPF